MTTSTISARILLTLAAISLAACAGTPAPSTTQTHPAPSTAAPTDLRAQAERPDASPAAQVAYGERLFNGDGTGAGINEAEAAKWFTKAADRGDALGRTRLADCLASGRGLVIDRPRALSLYRQAADAGLPEARYSLGECLAAGHGTPGNTKDIAGAVTQWTAAANAGFTPAQFRLAQCLKTGENSAPPDLAAAFTWFSRAAAQGHVASAANVGRAYLRGEGVAKDPVQAYAWSVIAKANGAALAQRTIDAATKELTPDQIETAKKQAAAFVPKPEPSARNN